MLSLIGRPRVDLEFAGLSVDVYRRADDINTTNDGVSSRHTTMTIYPEGPATRGDDDVIVDHQFGLRAIPYACWLNRRHVMFGGSFCFTSDSRLPSQGDVKLPIRIFDRVEEAWA